MIYELPWWNDVLTFSLAEPMRCNEFYWFAFLRLLSLDHSYIKSIYWKDLPFIEVTTSLEYALYWYTSDLNITFENPYFPLDRIWICATNAAVDDMNCYFAKELKGKTKEFPPIVGLTEIINKDQYDTRVFPEANQVDMLNNKKLPNVPHYKLSFQKGFPSLLMWNLDTQNGIVKNRRC